MNVTINTELFRTLGITPAVVLAICQTSPYLSTRLIAQMLGRDYSRTAAIVRDLKKRGYLQNAQFMQNAEKVMQNAQHEIMQNAQEKERKQEKENFPPHPLYKEKEINKEKDANNMTAKYIIGENAHTREEEQNAVIVPRETNDDKTTSELIAIDQHAKRHPLMLEQFCMNNYITPAVFAKLANEVATEWTLKGVTHASEADARQHFFNTIRLRAADLRRDQPKQRPLKLTWLPNEPLTLPADATDEERAAFLAEVDRRDKEYHKNDAQLPF